jgi:hypothetical protein
MRGTLYFHSNLFREMLNQLSEIASPRPPPILKPLRLLIFSCGESFSLLIKIPAFGSFKESTNFSSRTYLPKVRL